MTENRQPPFRDAGRRPGRSAVDDPTAEAARRLQILTTEHWSLLATRSLTWSEAFNRTGTFLSTLSAATVALALVGPATSFGGAFLAFALVILSVELFIGLTTFVRLVSVNLEDGLWALGMTMLRERYTRMAPGVEDDFVTGYTRDIRGVMRTFGVPTGNATLNPIHQLVTTPTVVLVVSSVIAGVIAALVAIVVRQDVVVSGALGVVVSLAVVGAGVLYAARRSRSYVGEVVTLYGEQAGSKQETSR